MVSIDASPIMSHYHLLIEALQLYLVKGGLDAISNSWEILTPLEVFLCLGGIGKVDEEQSLICQLVSPLERLPNFVVVRPALHEDDKLFAVLFSVQVIFKRSDTYRGHLYLDKIYQLLESSGKIDDLLLIS